MGRILKEFREFAMRGNVLDMAIGIIIGTAFGKIITSLVNDILMPPIGVLLGKVDFTNLFFNLSSQHYQRVADAKAAGAATINYGLFLNTIIDFIIVAFVIFLLIRQINRLKKKEENSDTGHQGMPVLPFGDTRQGGSLRILYFGAKTGARLTFPVPLVGRVKKQKNNLGDNVPYLEY